MERSPQVYVKPSSGVTSNDRGWEDFRENDVPCHHPQQKGLCFIDPHHAAEGNQKIHPFG